MYTTRLGDAGPRVVFVHGSAQGSTVGGVQHFSAQEVLAQRGLRLEFIDRPGHGRTPSPGRPDDAECDGALVAEILNEGTHLVGHSFGGCVAISAAALRPTSVRSLTLIEPATMPLATASPAVRRFGLKMLRVLYLTLSAEERIRRFVKLVNIPAEIRGGSNRQELREMGIAIRRLRIPGGALLRRQLAIIREAEIPLMVVSGAWNPAFDAAADAAALAGGGEHVVIRSPHHFPQMVSDEFNERLQAFVATSENTRGTRGY